MMGAIFAIVRRDPGVPALHLFDDLFVTGNGAAIDHIIEQKPNDARYFTGFVGWQPGELAKELEVGFWYVTDPDPALPFSKDTGRMWEELVKRVGKPAIPGSKPI
jgi:putative transcriptional regulator